MAHFLKKNPVYSTVTELKCAKCEMSIQSSVTRWVDIFLNTWPIATMHICPMA